jgi:transposase-like protein
MSDTFSKVEVITGVARRRRFSIDLKLAVVAETMQPGMSISYVARRHGLSPSLVFRWRRLMSEGGKEAVRADDDVVAASAVRLAGGAGFEPKLDQLENDPRTSADEPTRRESHGHLHDNGSRLTQRQASSRTRMVPRITPMRKL